MHQPSCSCIDSRPPATSSRNLIPLLATRYRVIAPDLPGYGFTNVPAERNYKYTFENLANTVGQFVDALGIKRFAIYIFDYGAPTGSDSLSSARRASRLIVSQNGNAYVEGFGQPFWSPIQKLWKSRAKEDRGAARPAQRGNHEVPVRGREPQRRSGPARGLHPRPGSS